MATFWAYTIAATLIRDFAAIVTYIDLGAIFVLGLIAGLAIALAGVLGFRQGRPGPAA